MGTVLGTDRFKKLRNGSIDLQMDSACRFDFRLGIQEVPKSLEADKEYRLLTLGSESAGNVRIRESTLTAAGRGSYEAFAICR